MSASQLDINLETFKRVDLVKLVGRVDSSNASELDAAFRDLIDRDRYNIVLDLSQVTYMSSAGLRALVALLRECKNHFGDVRLARPSERVREVLSLAGLDPLFEVHDDTASAVGSF